MVKNYKIEPLGSGDPADSAAVYLPHTLGYSRMRHIIQISFLYLTVVLFGVAYAVPPPPYPLGDSISWPQRSEHKPSTYLMMGAFEVRFEKTTLSQIINAVGKGTISHQGDAGESIYWVCYTTPNARLWIIADGEMGGPQHSVTQIAAEELQGVQAASDCPSLPNSFLPLSLDRSLWLGSKESTILYDLGVPSHSQGPWRSFNYEGKVPGECLPDGYDLMNWLLIKVKQGRVVELRAGQVTSC